METAEENSQIPPNSLSDWDRPFTDQELQAIDAAFESATSSSSSSYSIQKRHVVSPADDSSVGGRPRIRRKLPDSVFSRQSSGSFSLSPCPTTKMMMRYPTMNFGGRIVYSRTFAEVEKAAKELLIYIEAKKKEIGQVTLGFDIEWRPTFRRGVPPGKAAVMQICGDNSQCHVMHIIHSGIPQNLQSLLEDPTVVKVGVCIANDAFKVLQDHNVSVKATEDLSGVANKKLGGVLKNWSLGSLTEMVICKKLPKPGKIRLGNWETGVLSKEQLQYAATDAYASWYLYQVLKNLPDVADNGSECVVP